MEIVSRQNYQDLLGYLPHIKSSLKEWKLVDIRMTGDSEKYFTITRMGELVHSLFKDREGKIYLCNEHEIFLLIRWGHHDPLELSRKIEARLSAISYEIVVHEPTAEGLQKLEMLIRYEESGLASFADTRYTRRENVILVAADERYVRLLVKMGMPAQVTVQQVTDGHAVIAAYKKYVPDIVFLDVDLQGRDGTDVLQDILDIDHWAYIIMMSAEVVSAEHMNQVMRRGAKGFIAKPFSQGKLMEYFKKCSTLS